MWGVQSIARSFVPRAHLIAVLAVGVVAAGCANSQDAGEDNSITAPAPAPAAQVQPKIPQQPIDDARRGVALLRVAHVVDGDTISLRNGRRVRLAQIDTPEKYGKRECFGVQASAMLGLRLAPGAKVRLERDPNLDNTDQYGRLVRYVYLGNVNLNVWMVQQGAASVWYYGGVRGTYAAQLLRAAKRSRRLHRGLWGACAYATLDTSNGVSTGAVSNNGLTGAASGARAFRNSLPPAPQYPPDVDCADLLGPVRVTGDDPHNLDRDGDGIGCD